MNARTSGATNVDLAKVAAQAAECTRCDLYRNATQTVFGAGPVDARLMLVGEQPGDQEDRKGAPFVGPAGRVLEDALAEAGISADRVYVTNAVKHFKFAQRGKRRIHQKPNAEETSACHYWLEQELAIVRPDVIVALGATAGTALLGRTVRIGAERGKPIDGPNGTRVVITAHPSSILRVRDKPQWREAFAGLVDDLSVAAAAAGGGKRR